MSKIILSILLLSSLVFGATPLGKATGCDLSQDGDVSLNVEGYGSSKKADYVAAQKVGRNFKELFVGSSIGLKNIKLTITSITSNKRKKDKARTGTLSATLNLGSKIDKIDMKYYYLNGYFEAKGKQSNSKEVSFSLYIKALLCYSK